MSTEPSATDQDPLTVDDEPSPSIVTAPLGSISVPLPSGWQLGDPKYDDENAISTIYGPGGTRIDLLEVAFASHEAETGIMAKLFIADPAYSPASFEDSAIITDNDEFQQTLSALYQQVDT